MTGIVAPIVAQLVAAKSETGALAVEAVAGIAALNAQLATSPMQFVVPTGDTAGRLSSATMVTRQQGEERFDVVTGFLLATLKGTPAILDQVREKTRDALLGWKHPLTNEPVEYRGGRLLSYDFTKGTLWWQQSFAFTRIIEG
ncbi:hypothetical protein sos41_31300 [Alphaproteobacteria bacterium SO-S41]|nr:hypothetical protein sos41_31300 [Alphaproteobacteria bacterium SO-S41]